MTHLRSLQVPVIHKGLSLMKSNLHSWTSSNLHSFQIALESVCQGFSEERHTMVWKWAVDLHNVFISFALIFLEYLSKSSISLHELIRCGGNICVAARRASSLFPLVSHFCVVRLSLCHNVSELLRLLGRTAGLMMFLNYDVIVKHQYQKAVTVRGGRRRTSGSCLHMLYTCTKKSFS